MSDPEAFRSNRDVRFLALTPNDCQSSEGAGSGIESRFSPTSQSGRWALRSRRLAIRRTGTDRGQRDFAERDQRPLVTSTYSCSRGAEAAQILAWLEMDRIAIRQVFEDVDYGRDYAVDHALWPSPWPAAARARRGSHSLSLQEAKRGLQVGVGLREVAVRAALRVRLASVAGRVARWALPC